MDDAINIFYSTKNSFFNSCAPLYYPSGFNNQLGFSKELTHLRNKMSRLYRKFKDIGSQSIYSRYLSARSSFTVLNSLCYKNYLSRCKVQFSQNPRKFYNFFNTKRNSNNYPSSFSFENIIATTDQAIADLFAKFFQTTFSTLYHSLQPYYTRYS